MEVALGGFDGVFVDPRRREQGHRLRPGGGRPPLSWCVGLAATVRCGRLYRVEAALPFSLKALRAHLRAHGIGTVEIRKRGSAVDVNDLRRRLRLRGDAHATVILTRIANRPTALLCSAVP